MFASVVRCVLLGIVLGAGARVAAAEEKTSANNEVLKQALRRFPAADANKDGVLTESEANAFRQRQSAKPAGGNKNQPAANLPAPDHADVHYGPHERQVLDIWLAKSPRPTPLVVYIHGGGFVGGNKRSVAPQVIESCREKGFSVASLHNRFVTSDPFPAPQQDAARAIQFLRSKAQAWNLDEKRFAAYGGSAGGGLSLWLAYHDDLATPSSDDPVARQSTRLVAVGGFGTQTTYDPNLIKAWVGGRAYEHPSIFKCYGISSIDQIADAKLQPIYDEVSAIKHLTKDDPPAIMFYNEADGPLPGDARPGQGIHHPVFGRKLQEQAAPLGVQVEAHHTSQFRGNANEALVEFFAQHFAK